MEWPYAFPSCVPRKLFNSIIRTRLSRTLNSLGFLDIQAGILLLLLIGIVGVVDMSPYHQCFRHLDVSVCCDYFVTLNLI